MPETSDDELKDLYLERGMTYEQTARQVHRSVGYVHKRLQQAGVKSRKRGPAGLGSVVQYKEVMRAALLYEIEKMSISEIAQALGKPASTIEYHLQLSGVRMRSKSEAAKLKLKGAP